MPIGRLRPTSLLGLKLASDVSGVAARKLAYPPKGETGQGARWP